jgi:hypothetical protein
MKYIIAKFKKQSKYRRFCGIIPKGGDLVSTGIAILKLHAEGSIDLVNPDGDS